MNIAVQKSIPGNNQGKPGEMRLVVHSSGMYLYVKGYSTWGSLQLTMKGTNAQVSRNVRRRLQEDIRTVIIHGSSTAVDHGDGTIAGNMGTGTGAAKPDEPR